MSTSEWLAILGALAGTAGSIITAFAVNDIFTALHLANEFLSVTVEAIATNHQDVPGFHRNRKALRKSTEEIGSNYLGRRLIAGCWLRASSRRDTVFEFKMSHYPDLHCQVISGSLKPPASTALATFIPNRIAQYQGRIVFAPSSVFRQKDRAKCYDVRLRFDCVSSESS